jgi:4-aminobutyrate aminotransferase-like enzyme
MVSFSGSFHGRTMGALALTYKEQYKTPFAPGLPGARMAPYLDLDAAAAVIQKVRLRQRQQHMHHNVLSALCLSVLWKFLHVEAMAGAAVM